MQTSRSECAIDNYFSYFSTKTCVVGTEKNRLNEMFLLSTQNTCLNRQIRKYLVIKMFCFSGPMICDEYNYFMAWPKSNIFNFHLHVTLASLFVLLLYIPVNSYGHGGMVSSPNHTFFQDKLEQAVNQ